MVMDQGGINLAGPVKVLSQGEFPTKYADTYMTPRRPARCSIPRTGKRLPHSRPQPEHRSHEYLAKVAVEICDGLMIHSLLGKLKPGDIR